MINTLFPTTVAVEPTLFCCFPLALENTFPWPFVPILSNFFEEQRTQNHPQCLLGLSRALFPTTFLEIAVYNILVDKQGQGVMDNVKVVNHYSMPVFMLFSLTL